MRSEGRYSIAVIAGVVLSALSFGLPAAARDLTIAGVGGATQDAQRAAYFDPYRNKTNDKLVEDSWSNGLGILRAKVQSGDPGWDVVQVTADEAEIGCDEGLYEKLDWNKLGGEGAFLPMAVNECGVGMGVWATLFAYDSRRVKGSLKSWADFWDVNRFPGKRSLPSGPKFNLEFALMADGVPAADVYKVLSTPQGVDRAFAKLDQLKPHIIWWTAASQPAQLLASGEVTAAVIYSTRLFAAKKEATSFVGVWEGNLYTADFWVILKGSQNKNKAEDLIAFMTRPERQATYANLMTTGPTNKAGIPLVDKKIEPDSPTAPKHLAAGLPLDAQFWADHFDELSQRFTAWISR